MKIDQLVDKARDGGRLDRAEALELYLGAPTALLGRLAADVRARKHPDGIVTYIIDRNVNYTNVCVARCNFCAFYRAVGSPDGYVLGFEDDLPPHQVGEPDRGAGHPEAENGFATLGFVRCDLFE